MGTFKHRMKLISIVFTVERWPQEKLVIINRSIYDIAKSKFNIELNFMISWSDSKLDYDFKTAEVFQHYDWPKGVSYDFSGRHNCHPE